MIFPGSVWSVFLEGAEPLRGCILGPPEIPWDGGDGKEYFSQLISKPLGDPGHPSLGPSSTSQELSVEGSQAPGLWAARWGGSVAGSSGQPAKQQEAQLGETALGADQEGRREGGSRGGRGGGVGAQPGPSGAGPAANSAPTSGPGCPGCGNRGQQARAGRGETTCRRFLQEVPQAQLSCPGSSSADVVSKGEARNPRLPWFATLWALSKRAGVAAAPLPPSPGLCSLVSRCSSSV